MVVLPRSRTRDRGIISVSWDITLAPLVENRQRRRGRKCRGMISANGSASTRKTLLCYVLVHTTEPSMVGTAIIALTTATTSHTFTSQDTCWVLANVVSLTVYCPAFRQGWLWPQKVLWRVSERTKQRASAKSKHKSHLASISNQSILTALAEQS